MEKFKYFAYGSNMLAERLQKRCPSATVISVAIATGWSLDFSKKSIDGSGKATIFSTKSGSVYGVVFEIAKSEMDALDKAEGCGFGYERNDAFTISIIDSTDTIDAVTYIASSGHRDDKLFPYDWYKELVLTGAKKNRLPPEHISFLNKFPDKSDPKAKRKSRVDALKILGKTK
jgi:hypothetical protein